MYICIYIYIYLLSYNNTGDIQRMSYMDHENNKDVSPVRILNTSTQGYFLAVIKS